MIPVRPIWIVAVVCALAGPGKTQATGAADVVVVIDNSASMRRNDPHSLMHDVVRNFASLLGTDSRIGVVVFDKTSRLPMELLSASAPEYRSQLENAIRSIDYRGQLTDIPGAVEKALYELSIHGRPKARRVIVLLTDGYVDVGDSARDRDRRC